MFISFEKLYLVEMRIYFEQSIANLFVNGLFEIKIQYTPVDNFSKGFCMFFSISKITEEVFTLQSDLEHCNVHRSSQ